MEQNLGVWLSQMVADAQPASLEMNICSSGISELKRTSKLDRNGQMSVRNLLTLTTHNIFHSIMLLKPPLCLKIFYLYVIVGQQLNEYGHMQNKIRYVY